MVLPFACDADLPQRTTCCQRGATRPARLPSWRALAGRLQPWKKVRRSAGKTGNLVEMDRPQRDRGGGAGPLPMMTDRGMIHATWSQPS